MLFLVFLFEGEGGTVLPQDGCTCAPFPLLDEECVTGKKLLMLPCSVAADICFFFFVRSLIAVRGFTEAEDVFLTTCLLDPA